MIDVFVEMLKCKRDADNQHMEGEFQMSSSNLRLSSTFSFQMEADNLTNICNLSIHVAKKGKTYVEVTGQDAFYPHQAITLDESQKIVLLALSEVLEYFWGVHSNAKDVPVTTISGFVTQVPDEKAMEILGVCL